MLIKLKIDPGKYFNESKNATVVYGKVPLYKIKGKHSINSTLKETGVCVFMLKDYLDEVVFEGGLYFELQNVGVGLREEVSNLVIFINTQNIDITSFDYCHSFKMEYSIHQMDIYDPFKVVYNKMTHTNTPAPSEIPTYYTPSTTSTSYAPSTTPISYEPSTTFVYESKELPKWEDMDIFEKIMCVFMCFIAVTTVSVILFIFCECFYSTISDILNH